MAKRRALLRHLRGFPGAIIALGLLLVFGPGSSGCRGLRKESSGPPIAVVTDQKPPELAKPISDSLASALSKTTGPVAKPQNALLLSGGGQYASYNAGLLVGWTQNGTRPKFDVVTGISSGAVVAAYAFLGERYDGPLQNFFTTTSDKDLFQYRPFRQILRNDALADPARLVKLIEHEVNDCFLLDLREGHKEGRRLFIGTMNARTRRLCIWDVGAIACSDRPDAAQLVRKIFLAAESIPGLLPPVEFEVEVNGCVYKEEHVDGGAASQIFLRLPPGADCPAEGATGWLKGSNLYAMAAGKLYAPDLEGKIGFLKRVTSTISAALYALFRSEMLNLYAFCGVSGMKFHQIAVPGDAEIPPNSMTFDPKAMQKLFKQGYDAALAGIPWRFTPPGTEPGEEEKPRAIGR